MATILNIYNILCFKIISVVGIICFTFLIITDIVKGAKSITLLFDAACISSYFLYFWDTHWCPPSKRYHLKDVVLLFWIILALTAHIIYNPG